MILRKGYSVLQEFSWTQNYKLYNFPALQIFQQTCFCLAWEKHLHCTISWCPRTTFLKHFESKYLGIFLYISLSFLFQRCSNILSAGWWVGGRLNNFLKVTCSLDLIKCYSIFHFNWNFRKFNYFSAFQYFHL